MGSLIAAATGAAATLFVGLPILTVAPAQAGVCDGISTASATPLTTVRVASGLLRPLLVTSPPLDSSRLFIVQQDGLILIMKNGALLPAPFLDVSALTRSPADGGGDEQGLLGLAFAPDYATSGYFFIYHTDATGTSNLLVRYGRSASNPDLADTTTRQIVLSLAHPTFTNHNGGMLAFGPDDGYLYVGTGDGGGSCDQLGNSQNGASDLGKLLRIDVSTLPYAIPPTNPFVGPGGNNDEIWSLGLRNPWRYSFDRANGDLYIADVGQSQREEVDYRTAASAGGENYGWPKYEGSVCPDPSCGSANCIVPGYVAPVLDYTHAGGACAITGGYVYRGCRMPSLAGTYFYADYCAAFVESFVISGGAVTNLRDRTAELAPSGGLSIASVTSFGEDARGEIYIVDRGTATGGGTGEVFEIVPVLGNLEVSGIGATPFTLTDRGTSSWTWEDLQATSSQPIAAYRVHRSAGPGNGAFDCVHQGPSTSWLGGDPALPAPGGLFSYLVVAVDATGGTSSPGAGSIGAPPRVLSALPCPP